MAWWVINYKSGKWIFMDTLFRVHSFWLFNDFEKQL